MTSPSTIVFAGGGTGGHLFPGIAIARLLQSRSNSLRVVFVGSTRTIESMIVAEQGFEHEVLPVESLATLQRNPWRFAWCNWNAWRVAAKRIRELQPTVVVGLGGFASAPLVYAARRQQIPVVLLEQNAIAGRTNRWLSRFADHVCVTFAESQAQVSRTAMSS